MNLSDKDKRRLSTGVKTLPGSLAHFKSGATRSERKPGFHRVPTELFRRVATRFDLGAEIHGGDNWKLAAGDVDYFAQAQDHMMDHLLNYMAGDRSEDHLAAIAWGCAALMWFEAQEER